MQTFFNTLGSSLAVAILVGIVLAALYPLIRPTLLKRAPVLRATALLGWAVAPAVIGLFFTVLLLMPTWLKRIGVPTGHCHNHNERFLHICLSEPLPINSQSLPGYMITALLLLAITFIASQLWRIHTINRLKATLHTVGNDSGSGYKIVAGQRPIAVTVGLWTPEIFLSQSLCQGLSAEQLEVVLAHERAHVKRRDSLRYVISQALSYLYLPRTRNTILADLTLATEQACDEKAATKTGDRLLVAETIVAVEHLLGKSNSKIGSMALGFASNHSALRIEALLNDQADNRPALPEWFLLSTLPLVTSVIMPGPFHYLSELIIRHG